MEEDLEDETPEVRAVSPPPRETSRSRSRSRERSMEVRTAFGDLVDAEIFVSEDKIDDDKDIQYEHSVSTYFTEKVYIFL